MSDGERSVENANASAVPTPASSTPPVPAATAPTGDAHAPGHGSDLKVLVLAALGVVYGDIGTSPLYALRECFGHHGTTASPANVLGVLSLVIWSLVLIITVKYLAFIMKADNRGEGGILALMALTGTRADATDRRKYMLILFGLFGAALLYGDGIITPAISVLSAVEGLGVATHTLGDSAIRWITIVILASLFAVQRSGTGKVGAVFGPIMLVWFIVLGVLGVTNFVDRPQVFEAFDPRHGIDFFRREGFTAFRVLGSVFLVVTGGEALYADMGHFGKRPIRVSWYSLVLPALLLNYLGQAAVLLNAWEANGNAHDKVAVDQLFYRLAPDWALYPLVGIATAATVIASQALISACFSLTRQAVQLGYFPRVQIVHTSSKEMGQIYVPAVNIALAISCVLLVWEFGSSSALAAAYGIAVTGTMGITTILFYAVAVGRWGWAWWKAGLLCSMFLVVDLSFFGANALKVMDGGWFPLVVGAGVFTLLSTWKRGREILSARLQQTTLPMEVFLADLGARSPQRVPGNAVFMSGSLAGVPHALLHNLKHNKVLHQRNVLLTLQSEEVPHVADADRLEIEDLGHGFVRLVARIGFMESPDVPALLELAKKKGYEYKLSQTTFFLGRETLIATERRGMAIWREKLFAWMSLNARSATAYFNLPPNRVVELGAQIEL